MEYQAMPIILTLKKYRQKWLLVRYDLKRNHIPHSYNLHTFQIKSRLTFMMAFRTRIGG